MDARQIILVGLSGCGKTTVGRLLARRLRRPFIDTDGEIARSEGRSIPAIFATDGEDRFRALEVEAVQVALAGPPAVVSLGGGALLHPTTRIRCAAEHLCWLDADPAILARRVAPSGSARGRPLLAAADPEARLRELLAQRRQLYGQAHLRVDATPTPDGVAAAIQAALERLDPAGSETLTVRTSGGTYPVVSGRGTLAQLPVLARDLARSRRAFVVSDTTVWPIAGALLEATLRQAEWLPRVHAVPAGEQTKTTASAEVLWTWLAEEGAERKEPVLAFGGGVVGDLAGFVAATYLRGVPLVQIATTLLAQVDSSIGGKVAVDHPLAKNMIGAFKPPDLVIVDTALLAGLPPREIAAGWVEVLKHGVILDAGLFALMEAEAERLSDLSPDLTLQAVRRSLAIKARVVEEDEFEQGPRMLLNYGHTLGQAVEAATGYARFLHGEAVSLGMVAAGWMAAQLGLLAPGELARIEGTLARLGSPVRVAGLDAEAVLAAMRRDKKVRQGKVTWVLPRGIGQAIRTADVPPELAGKALSYLAGQPDTSGTGGRS